MHSDQGRQSVDPRITPSPRTRHLATSCRRPDRTTVDGSWANPERRRGNKLLLSTPTCRYLRELDVGLALILGVISLLFVPRPVGLALALPDLLVALHTRTPPSDADPVLTTETGSHHQHPRRNPRCQSCSQPGSASEDPVRPRRETRARELALGPCSTPRFLHPAGTAGGSTHSPPRLAPGNWLQPPSCRLPPPPITDKRVLPTLTLPSDMAAIDASPLSRRE